MSNLLKKNYFITSKKEKIFYFDSILNKENTIFLLHDFMRSSSMFSKLAKELINMNRVISIDLPGHGKNSKITTNSLDSICKTLNELIHHLHLSNLNVIAYGTAGIILLNYIETYGESSFNNYTLIDCTPKYINDDCWKNGLYRGSYTLTDFNNDKSLISSTPYKFMSRYFSNSMPIYSDDTILNNLESTLLFKFIGRFLYKKNAITHWSMYINQDFRKTLSTIKQNVNLIYPSPGSLLSNNSALYMSALIPNNNLYEITNSSHTSVIYKTEELLDIINSSSLKRKFLTKA